jgi:hypothetical protein
LWWYVTGLAVIGLAGGFFAGASRTPIVATLLPLLFAIVGGTSGVYLATADLSAHATLARLQWLGRAFGVFGLGCLLGSAIGISLRLGFAHPASENELTTLWHGTTQDALQLAALRWKLQALGASPREQDLFLRTASEAMHDAVVPIPGEHVRDVASAALNLSNELRSIVQKATQARQPVPQDANKVIAALDLFYHQTEPWSKSAMPRSLYKNAVESVWYWMSHVAMPQDPALATWARQVGFQTDRLDELYQKLRAEFELRDDLDWEMGGATSERLDKFLQLIGKSLKAAPDRDDLMPAIDMDAKPAPTKSAAEQKEADKK